MINTNSNKGMYSVYDCPYSQSSYKNKYLSLQHGKNKHFSGNVNNFIWKVPWHFFEIRAKCSGIRNNVLSQKLSEFPHKNQICQGWSGSNGICLAFVYVYLAQKPDIIPLHLLQPGQPRYVCGDLDYFLGQCRWRN